MSQRGGRPAWRGPGVPASQWRELADLPFAAALVPRRDGWRPGAEYDCAHFDQLTLDGPDGSGSRFLECALTHVSCQAGQLRRATFTDTWLADVRLTGTGLAESAWTGVQIADTAIAGAEAFGARLRGVVLRGCKLDSVNLRDAALTDVVFDSCLLRDVNFTGATLTRSAFPGCPAHRHHLRQGQPGHGRSARCRTGHHRRSRLPARHGSDVRPVRRHGRPARQHTGHHGRRVNNWPATRYTSLSGVTPADLAGFFTGWPVALSPARHQLRRGRAALTRRAAG